MRQLEKYQEVAYALLRIMAGYMFLFHGLQKHLGLFTDFQPPAWSQLWFGGFIELLGGLAVMVGFQTRIAAFVASGMMAVAYFQFHWKFQLGSAFFPIVNHGELAILYCFVFFYIACRGGGIWSVDGTGEDVAGT